MSSKEYVKVGEELTLNYGKSLPARDRITGQYEVVGSNGVVDRHNQFAMEGPGIVVGRKGSVGALTWLANNFWAIDTTYYASLNGEGDLKYWYYQLSDLKLDTLNSHAAVPGLNRDNVYRIEVLKRSRVEQEKIAKILGDLDRKIELNRQMNETLEQIGQTLFKKYFVDSLESGGWKNSEISEIAEHVKISRKPQEEPDDDFLQYSIPAFDSGLTPEVSVGSKIMSNKYQVIENSILVSKLNPSTPRVWPVFNAEKNAVCSTEFVVLKPKKYYAFIYFLLNSRLYKETMIAAAGGTSNSHKRVSPGFITSFAFPTPPSELLDSFEAAAHNLIYKQQLNISETVTLSKLRDSLLPKLISGEIKV